MYTQAKSSLWVLKLGIVKVFKGATSMDWQWYCVEEPDNGI